MKFDTATIVCSCGEKLTFLKNDIRNRNCPVCNKPLIGIWIVGESDGENVLNTLKLYSKNKG